MTNPSSLALRTGSVLRQIDGELRESGIRISQLKIAKEAGVTPGLVSKLFGGTVALSFKRLPAVAKALSNQDPAREQDYLRRLNDAINPLSQTETSQIQGRKELKEYALQLLGDLGVSQDQRDKLLENPSLVAALSDCMDPKFVDGIRVIRTAGLSTFFDNLTRDSLRLGAARLAIQNLKTLDGPV